MDMEGKKKLVVVTNKKMKNHANLLRNLVTQNDDVGGNVVGTKDGTVDMVMWSDEDFVANQPKMSSSQKVLFIGTSKHVNGYIESLEYEKFKESTIYGINIYIGGNMAAITVDKGDTTKEEYEKLIHHCEENNRLIKERVMGNEQDESKKRNGLSSKLENWKLKSSFVKSSLGGGLISAGSASGLFLPMTPAAAAVLTVQKIKKMNKNNKITAQKYSIGVQEFYVHYMQKFLDK